LRRAHIERADVSLVSTDFEHDDWLAGLIDAGFDRNTPALFLWEGVTPYLSRAAVDATLQRVASTSKGSVVGFDCFTTEVLESTSPALRMLRASLNASGEPLKFGVDSTPPLRDGVAR
jgi:methyltransferase (TIGR00027 family)